MSRQSGQAGDRDAVFQHLRTLLLGDDHVGPQLGEAYRLCIQLAAEGDAAAAAHAAVFCALGIGRVPDWNAALDFLAQAAALGDKSARRQLAALGARKEPRLVSGEASDESLWRRVREEIDLDQALTPPAPRIIAESPSIQVIEGFSPPPLSALLIRNAQHRLQDGEVNDATTGEVRRHPMRTAKYAPLNVLNRDLVTALLQERAARATGIALANHEPPNVISYMPGQQFEPHYDYVDPDVAYFQMELMLQGQRIATSVTYLNDDFEGAETAFPRLNWRFKGKAGDAIIFYNVTPDGRVDPRTLHAGLPPTRGRKWVLSQWLRNRPQPLV